VIYEISILVKVDHPNCVWLIEWFEDEYHIFVVMFKEGICWSLLETIILKKYSEK